MNSISSLRPALAAAIALAVVLSGCNRTPNETASAPVATTTPATKPDVVAANVDTSVNPGDDFFQFANGAWLKAHPIPATEASWGIGMVVRDELYDKLRKISEDAAKSAGTPGSDEQKIGDFWSAAVDEKLAENQGVAPLRPYLDKIAAANDLPGVLDAAFDVRRLNVDVFYDFGVLQDERASDVMALHLDQGGLGLPDRDYYFKTEEGIVKARAAYVTHLQHVFKLLGADDAAADASAKQVMAFETALAKSLARTRRPPRSDQELQQDVAGRADAEIYAGHRLEQALRRLGCAADIRDRRRAGILHRVGGATQANPGAGAARLSARASGRSLRAVSRQQIRRRTFRFLRPHAERPEAAEGTLEARARFGKPRHRHDPRPALRRGIFLPKRPRSATTISSKRCAPRTANASTAWTG